MFRYSSTEISVSTAISIRYHRSRSYNDPTRFIQRILVPLFLLGIILYTGDYLRLKLLGEQFGTVEVKRFYAVKLKNRKTEYLRDDPQAVPCTWSAFPQMGYAPCWYLSRHRVQTVDIDAGRAQPVINTP